MNPERAALFAHDTRDRTPRGPEADQSSRSRRPEQSSGAMEGVNPSRAAMIGDGQDHTPSRPSRDLARERGGAITNSPRRGGRHADGGALHEPPLDDRSGRPQLSDPRAGGRESHGQPPPSPPSQGAYRPSDRAAEQHVEKAGREPHPFPRYPPRETEADPRSTTHYDQNYGRLNPVQAAPEIPSGPRGRTRGSARGNQGAPQGGSGPPRGDGRFPAPEMPRPPSPGPSQERYLPTGPASGRSGRSSFEHGQPLSVPGGPIDNPAHMDRARGGYGMTNDAPIPDPASNPPGSGVHPDRLAQMRGPNSSLPPPPPAPVASRQHHGHGRHAAPSHYPPESPVQYPHQSSNSQMSQPVDINVPTGPSAGTERSRGGGRRQLAGIQSTLQQASANMPDVSRSTSNGNLRRGQQLPPSLPPPVQSTRQMLGNSDVQVLAGGSPAVTPGQERHDPLQREPMPPNGIEGVVPREGERSHRDRESRSDRPSRSSHRGDRDRNRERHADRERDRERGPQEARDGKEPREPREPRGSREGHDRRSITQPEALPPPRDSRRSGRDHSGRETMLPPLQPPPPPPPPMHQGGGRDLMAGREGRHHGGARPPMTPDEHGMMGGNIMVAPGPMPGPGGGGGGGRSSRGGHRQDDRPREDRGRKRRSEDGAGGMGGEREKRPRR